MIKIGFTGAECSGKTTIVKELLDEIEDSCAVGSIARSCPLPISNNTTLETQMWIMSERIKRELEQKAKYVLCERTIVDDYAYCQLLLKSKKYIDEDIVQVGNRKYTVDEFEYYENMFNSIAYHWIKSYDYIFYLSPLPFVDDDIRPKNTQEEIDKIIRNTLNNIEHVKIDTDNLKGRIDTVLDIII